MFLRKFGVSRRIYQVLFLVIIIACSLLFFKEVKSSVTSITHIDKVAHFGVFFVLTGFLKRAFKAPFWLYILILAAYGAGVEYVQGTIPHREASLADFIADVAGIVSYLVVSHFWHKRYEKSKHSEQA